MDIYINMALGLVDIKSRGRQVRVDFTTESIHLAELGTPAATVAPKAEVLGKPEAGATSAAETPKAEKKNRKQQADVPWDLIERWMNRKGIINCAMLAARTGIYAAELSRWKRAEKRPTEHYWPRLAQAFGVTMDEFLRGPEEKKDINDENDQKVKDGRGKTEKSKGKECGVAGVLKILEGENGENGEYVDPKLIK